MYPMRRPASSHCARGDDKPMGWNDSSLRCCYWKPLLIRRVFMARFYRAASWRLLGKTKGFRRVNATIYRLNHSPKWLFVYPLQRDARRQLSQPLIKPKYQYGESKLMLTKEQLSTLPEPFKTIPDPRRAQGQRHRLSTYSPLLPLLSI